MKRRVYQIQIRSVKEALEHLHAINLEELEECAREFGTETEIGLVRAIRLWIEDLPPTH